MFKKPIHISIFLAGFVFILILSMLLIFSELAIGWCILLSSLIAITTLLAAQRIISKFIYDRMKLMFNKVLNINYEQRVLKINEDPFQLIDERLDSYIQEQEEQNELFVNQQQFRREYIGNIAHELKTPIFTIQGYILTLLDGGLEDERINRNYLERTDKSIDRLIDLLDNLDLITRLDSGQIPLEIETFDIINLCKDVFDSLELKAKGRNIDLKFSNLPKHQVFVDADRPKIFQVISNLMVNAIKYGKDHGTVSVGFSEINDDYILIEIADNGIGISDENLLRIFERFYRVDKSRGRKLGGSGLGLSIVKHIIEAHDQTLNVTSKEGEGSIFSFTLKLS